MGDESDISIIKRAKGFFKDKSITPSSKADEFITENLPEYIDEYKLATKSDLNGVDKRIEKFVEEIDDMKEWKKETKERVHENMRKIERLEKSVGEDDK